MKIKWLGHSTFSIDSNETVLVTDPHNPMFGKLPKDLIVTATTISHKHADHNYPEGLAGDPQIIDKVGSFTVDDIKINGIATFHDAFGGGKRGDNIVYIFDCEGLRLCHMGDLGHVLSEQQVAEIGKVDILMVPVGGFFTVGADEAVQITNQLKPKIVLPMHYKPEKSLMPIPIAGADKFIKALGWNVSKVGVLDVNPSTIDSFDHQIVLFK